MNFTFTEEQRLLEDTVRKFVARDYNFEKRNSIIASHSGWSRDVWRTFAEIGLLALNIPEEHGGLSAGPVETMLVMNGLGHGLVVEPYIGSAVLATCLIRLAGDSAAQFELLPSLATGESIAAVAHYEPNSRYDLNHVETRATRSGADYRLSGKKTGVLYGGAADVLLVSARTSGSANEEKGISLFAIKRDAPGVTVKDYPTLDEQRQAHIELRDVAVPASSRLSEEGGAFAAIEQAFDIALAALCAEAVGAMKAVLDSTVEYLRTRRQFGQPIGRF